MKRVLRTIVAGILCFGALLGTSANVFAAAPTNGIVWGKSQPTVFNVPRNPHPTSAEQKLAASKDSRALAWVLAQAALAPRCVVDPNTGQCYYDRPVSIGGFWVTEPSDETNWCGPGAATAAYSHWNYYGVVNHSPITVTNNAGGQSTYYNGQAWMADFAAVIPVDGRQGVMNRPYSNGTDATVLRDGLNYVTGTSYYVYYNPPNESDMMGNVEYDIGHDGHPMVYLANTNYLSSWNPGLNINHYVEGYGYDITEWYNAMYADSAPHTSQGNYPGDYTISQDQMWQAVSNAYWIDSSGVHHLIAVIIM